MPALDIATLTWAHRAERPDPASWQTSEEKDARFAVRWLSLHQAINYVIGVQRDRAGAGLHLWIRTQAGHIYSPITIEVMAEAMDCQPVRHRARKALVA